MESGGRHILWTECGRQRRCVGSMELLGPRSRDWLFEFVEHRLVSGHLGLEIRNLLQQPRFELADLIDVSGARCQQTVGGSRR